MEPTEKQIKEAIDCLIEFRKLLLQKVSLEVELATLTKELHMEDSK